MARSLASKPNIVAPASPYIYGRIKDNPGNNTGTPVNEQVYGDIHQFFERLLALGGVTANGLPENNTNGFQYNVALANLIAALETSLKGGVPVAGDTLNKLYTLITAMGRPRGGFDASPGTVPSNSPVNEAGDFWRITVAGTIPGLASGSTALKAGDLLIADVDGATSAGQFYSIQSNVDQATSSVLGLVKLYTDLAASNTDGSVTQSVIAQFVESNIAYSNSGITYSVNWTTSTVEYKKTARNTVKLKGILSWGSGNADADVVSANLPLIVRPSQEIIRLITSSMTATGPVAYRLRIQTNGDVSIGDRATSTGAPMPASSNQFSLDGIEYDL